MNEVSAGLAGPTCAILCTAVCASGCLACISDGPIIIVDAVTGGTALTSGTATAIAG